MLVFLPVNAYVKTENVQRGVQKAHSHSPLFCSLSGVSFWPLSGPNPSKRILPPVLLLICLPVFLALLWWSVLAAQQPKSIKTDLPSSSALDLLSCAPCCLWRSALGAQRPKSFKTDLTSSSTLGLLGCAPCSFWWPVLATEPPESFKAGFPSCSLGFCAPFSVGFCAPFSLWCSVLASERPKSFKTSSSSCYYCFSASFHSLVLRFGLWAANPAEQVGRSVLKDLGRSAAKTDHQKEKGTETHRQLLYDEVAVPVCVQEHERYYSTPPHTTPPHPPTPPCFCFNLIPTRYYA